MSHSAAPPAPEELLRAIDQIETSQLKPFLSQVLARVARRIAPSLPARESELLREINRGLPSEVDQRFRQLVARRREGALGDAERAELLRLTDQVEMLQADRVARLIELARLRGKTLPEVMDELGLEPPAVE